MSAEPRAEGPERTLDRLSPGESGRVLRIDGDPGTARRLMELGLVPGTEVTYVRLAPLGDPIEVAVRGFHLSVRGADAVRIHVATR